jgi:hypothetical protein
MFATLVSDFSRDGNVARSANLPRLFPRLFLWFLKHVILLKCLLQSVQVIRTPENTHGGLAIQSLHVWSGVCTVTTTALTEAFAHELLGNGTR